MDIRTLTPFYSVSPQVEPADMAALKSAGFAVVINNRPDDEVPPELGSAALRAAAEAAGLVFHDNPVINGGLTMAEVERQARILDEAEGPVFAYCRSGTRCSIVWALGQAGRMPVDQILSTAAAAGYDLGHLRPQLEMLTPG